MGYIDKTTSPLINTKITDAGRMKIAQGNFNIKYFQVGDSEVCYNDQNFQNFTDSMVLQSEENYQNLVPFEVNKTAVKYPLLLDENNQNTFGIVFSDAKVDSVHNRAFVAGQDLFRESGELIKTESHTYETPENYWDPNTIMFESFCDEPLQYTTVWNINIPWSESPAGVPSSSSDFNDKEYLGTKELLGYNSNNGQNYNNETYYYNSLGDKINVLPNDQKTIAIVHYTNNTISNVYGEKFSMEPYSSGEIGEARNFKITIPWLRWHKSSSEGQEFYVDPPNNNLLNPYYIESAVNDNLNEPGLRYFHLWDTSSTPNRVGKVWPDLKIITFDDEEIVAVLSGKGNRTFTLPAPKIGLVTPSDFNGTESSDNGLLVTEQDTLWVTYRLEHATHTYMHCNYYQHITGTDENCLPDTANVVVNFGNEFGFLDDLGSASKIYLLAQKVTTGDRPNPTMWKKIDVTSQITSGVIDSNTITSTTFVITKTEYDSAPNYSLGTLSGGSNTIDLGDEGIFFGTIETDIQATIYVANFLCNLSSTQYLTSTNPTWDDSKDIYVTEVGLYDDEKNLMIISKLQSPQRRVGVQQYSIKIDI